MKKKKLRRGDVGLKSEKLRRGDKWHKRKRLRRGGDAQLEPNVLTFIK